MGVRRTEKKAQGWSFSQRFIFLFDKEEACNSRDDEADSEHNGPVVGALPDRTTGDPPASVLDHHPVKTDMGTELVGAVNSSSLAGRAWPNIPWSTLSSMRRLILLANSITPSNVVGDSYRTS